MKIEEMISNNSADCYGCEACKNICPKKCISMERDEEGFAYPKINHNVCVQCGKCEKVCPSLNVHEKNLSALPKIFVAVNPDEKIRRHSSSGGVFSALSEIILNDGGIIFGAGFDENFHVRHMSAENFDELEKLRGSKYVQSQIGEVYRQVKKNLDAGREVLFSGTACQCAGLKNFLGGDSEKLLTVDVFCHGTPSPLLWESYIAWRSRGHEISHVNFKSKRTGWLAPSFEITFKDCPYFARQLMADIFSQEFLINIILRPSCYACKFKFPAVQSDLSIGDAWGIQNFAQEFFDNRGTSLAVAHTDKGLFILNKTKLIGKQVTLENILPGNPNFLIPPVENPHRKNFFADLKEIKNPVAVMQKYFQQDPSQAGAEIYPQNSKRVAEKYYALFAGQK